MSTVSSPVSIVRAITRIAAALNSSRRLTDTFGELCEVLCAATRFPDSAVARISLGGTTQQSPGFRSTPWGIRRAFETPHEASGSIEVYYTARRPWQGADAFAPEEEDLLDSVAVLLTGAATREAFDKLVADYGERIKELGAISRIVAILKREGPFDELLQPMVDAVPAAWQYPECAAARITYGDRIYQTANFDVSPWMQRQPFAVPAGVSGSIEICYTREMPIADEGPFLKEERTLIENLAQLIAAAAGSRLYEALDYQNRERLKELAAINQTTRIITRNAPVEQTLQDICAVLPASWQFPQDTVARIAFNNREYVSAPFADSPWSLREEFATFDNQTGSVEVCYLHQHPESDEGPFMKEERDLIRNIARLIAHYLNDHKGRTLIERGGRSDPPPPTHPYRELLPAAPTPLQSLLNRHVHGRQTHVDILRHRVKDVLLVATFFDAFAIQNDDPYFGQFVGALQPLALLWWPRITVVFSREEALEKLPHGSYELVIVMVGLDTSRCLALHADIMAVRRDLPVYFMANRADHAAELMPGVLHAGAPRKMFVWNGDSRLFFAMVRLLEDAQNAPEDFASGLVRAILVVEDSPDFSSQLLTSFYGLIFEHAQRPRVGVDESETDRMGRFLYRPRILLARTYQDAAHYVSAYGDHLLCVISDIEFENLGTFSKTAGFELIRTIRLKYPSLPCLLHSTEKANAQAAEADGVTFVDKSARGSSEKVRRFVENLLDGGEFVFSSAAGAELGRAASLRKFVERLDQLPADSIRHHARRGDFSRWLMARGESELAIELGQADTAALNDDTRARQWLIGTVRAHLLERNRGKVVGFDHVSGVGESYVVKLVGGSLGGKGRGVAFLNALVHELDTSKLPAGMAIRTPLTAIVATEEFERMMQTEKVRSAVIGSEDYERIRRVFDEVELSARLRRRLRAFVEQVKRPIAVRSSSLFEDSLSQPCAGAFETYIIPNCHPDPSVRLRQLEQAIKQVYASLYRPDAQVYFAATRHGPDEERMAVVLQELVGQYHDSYYYPHISGVARSYNFYPVAHMKPDEGFVVLAFGLGVYVVEGRSGHRFSPRYPAGTFGSTKDMLSGSQVQFYAVNTGDCEVDLLANGEKAALSLLDLSAAEEHGTLTHCVSVYDPANDRLVPGLRAPGPRLLNFADILQYNFVPLADTVGAVLDTLKEAMGVPVEIEFAVDLDRRAPDNPRFTHCRSSRSPASNWCTISTRPRLTPSAC